MTNIELCFVALVLVSCISSEFVDGRRRSGIFGPGVNRWDRWDRPWVGPVRENWWDRDLGRAINAPDLSWMEARRKDSQVKPKAEERPWVGPGGEKPDEEKPWVGPGGEKPDEEKPWVGPGGENPDEEKPWVGPGGEKPDEEIVSPDVKEPMNAGGWSDIKRADTRVRNLVRKLERAIERAVCNRKNKCYDPEIVPINYKTQVVAGTLYLVRLHINGKPYQAKIFEQSWTNTRALVSIYKINSSSRRKVQ